MFETSLGNLARDCVKNKQKSQRKEKAFALTSILAIMHFKTHAHSCSVEYHNSFSQH